MRPARESETIISGASPGGFERARPVREIETVSGGQDADWDGMPLEAGARTAPRGVADLAEFQRSLVDVGLIDAQELKAFAADSSQDVLGLVRVLVKAGRLTAYQAAAVYQRKSRGLLIGNYLVLDKLGRGGMGMVFKARRPLGPAVALKILPPKFSRDRTAVLRFKREFEAAGRVKHPNLVAALEFHEDRGVYFLVMDFVSGRNLEQVVRDRGPMPILQGLDCLIQAARGLEAAHAQGIVHRDVKPSNLMLDAAGTVRMLDLGLARVVEAANPLGRTVSGRLTESGMYMGSIDYTAPEQAEDSSHADHRADIYSLGCTLYFLLTGREPFVAKTVLKRLFAHQEHAAPSLRAARPEVLPALEAAYQNMMAKLPDDRPGTMTEVISLLERCKAAAKEAKLSASGIAKARPNLMVFDNRPPQPAAPPVTEREPTISPSPKDPAGLRAGCELSIEDLAMDISAEDMPAEAPLLKRLGSARFRRQRRRTIGLALAAIAALGLVVAGLVRSCGPVRSRASQAPAAGQSGQSHG